MKPKNLIQVFEYQKLRYVDSMLFKQHHFESMVKFNEQNQNKYFTIIHKGVQFNSYVGVIQIDGLTIEILPKADRNKEGDKALWQNVLLNMLKVCKRIPVETVSETQLKKKYNSILDVYFELFLTEVSRLVNRGLIKKYQSHHGNQKALKGRLLFSKNIQRNLVHKERFYCEYTIYNKDHEVHQILYCALRILDGFINPALKDKLNRLLFEFQDFEKINVQPNHFKKIVFNRKNQHYERAVEIAKIIILNYSPSLNYGNDNMLTLLFDMNVLWEEFIYRTLHKHKPEGVEVKFQNVDRFWENKTIRPDIVVKTEDDTFVIDTKWKIVESNKPSDDDLKQMFTYNLHWGAKRTMLLYPKIDQKDSEFGLFHYGNLGLQCKLGFVDVKDDESIKSGELIAEEIFGKLIF